MGSTPKAPAPYQDPHAEADTQAKYNLQAQEESLVNQHTPYGSLNYKSMIDPVTGVPQYTATTELSPAQQQLLDNQTSSQTTAGGGAAQLLKNTIGQYETDPNLMPSYDANGNVTSAGGQVNQNTQNLTNALMKQYTSYVNPQFDYQTSTLDNQLRNQGLEPGTPAYDQQMKNLRLNQNQSVTGFLANIEPQAFSQAVQQYKMPLDTAGQLMQLGSPTGLNNTQVANTSAAHVDPSNYTGAVNSYNDIQQKNYASEVAAQQNQMAGMFGLPTALAKLPTAGGGSVGGSAMMKMLPFLA